MSYSAKINGKTYQEEVDHVNSLPIQAVWRAVFERLYPGAKYSNHNTGGESDSAYYNNVFVYQLVNGGKVSMTKLPFSDYQAEEAAYKAEIVATIDSKYAAYQPTWDKLERLRSIYFFQKVSDNLAKWTHDANGNRYTNQEIWAKDIVEAGDDQFILDCEAQQVSFSQPIIDRNGRVRKALEAHAFCHEMLALTKIMILEAGASEPQRQSIKGRADVKAYMAELVEGNPEDALAELNSIDVANVAPLSQAQKDELIGKFNDFLGV